MKRGLVFVAQCAMISGIAMLSATSAGAAPLSDCTSHRGTVVAVDFAHWGGPIVRGCGIGQPTGYALLHAAGFTTGGDAHDGAAFVCRIGNPAFDGGTVHPTPGEERCTATPSTSAYWSYWVAPAGQSTWTYSPLGPMGDVPKPGEVELWMFGSTNVGGTRGSGVPKFSPNTLRAANSAPAPHASPAPSTTAPRTATRASSPPAARAQTARQPAATRRSASRPGQPRGSPRKPPNGPSSPRRSAIASPPPVVSAQPTGAHTSSGSAGPLVIGLCLALVVAAGAGRAVWRRRRYG